MKTTHTIQILADNGTFVDYTSNIGTIRPVHTTKAFAGEALKELQQMTKGHGFQFRINSVTA